MIGGPYVRTILKYLVSFLLGGVATYFSFPRRVPGPTKTEVRTVTEVVYKEVEKKAVKNVTTERKITKKNGDVIEEHVKSDKHTEENAKVLSDKTDNTVKVEKNEVPKYGLGIGCDVHLKGFCGNPYLTGSVRLGDSPLWLDGNLSKSLDVKLGIRWEF